MVLLLTLLQQNSCFGMINMINNGKENVLTTPENGYLHPSGITEVRNALVKESADRQEVRKHI